MLVHALAAVPEILLKNDLPLRVEAQLADANGARQTFAAEQAEACLHDPAQIHIATVFDDVVDGQGHAVQPFGGGL